MSDAIDRDAAIRAIEDAEVYTFSDGFPDARGTRREMIAALRALPAVPPSRITRAEADARLDATLRKMAESDRAPRVACPKCYAEFPASPAERLARAADALDKARDDRARASMGPTQPWVQALSRLRTADDEFMSALAAFRAAKPPVSDGKSDSTGAAPPAAEPAPRIVAASEVISSLRAATAAAQAARQDDGNPEPAPCVGTNCANPRCNYMVLCGMICNKCGSIAAKAACSACRPGGAA